MKNKINNLSEIKIIFNIFLNVSHELHSNKSNIYIYIYIPK